MSIALHIFKKDLRRLWPLLGIMFVYVGVRVAVLMHDLLSGNPPHIEPAYLQSPEVLGPPGIEILVLLILVPLILVQLIHQEPLVGTSAFWLTRPIPRGSLIAAKASFILLFLIAVPVAANFIVLFHYGLEANRILPVLLIVLSIYLALIGISIAAAVLTWSIQAFVVALGAALLFMPLAAKLVWIDAPANPLWLFSHMFPGALTALLSLGVIFIST
jgi:hypothetical protein